MDTDINYTPKISVFLTTYNHSEFIAEAIESILVQEYKNIEIVIGDDYSLDNTREIITKYADLYPEIFKLIFHKENIGITRNCNAVLEQCVGEYIALFSGDDVWLPGKLKAQINWFIQNPLGVLCYTATEVIGAKGEFIRMANTPDKTLIEKNIIKASYNMAENSLSYMIRRSAIPKRGFPNEIPVFSDWYFTIAICFKGLVGGIDTVFSKYRKHTNSSSTKNVNIEKIDHLACLIYLREDFPDYKLLIDMEIKAKIYELAKANSVDFFDNITLVQILKYLKKYFLRKFL